MIYGRQLCPQSLASMSAWGSFSGNHKKLTGPQIPEKGAPLGDMEFDKQRVQVPTNLQLGWLGACSYQLMTVPHFPSRAKQSSAALIS